MNTRLSVVQWRCWWKFIREPRGYLTMQDIRNEGGNIRTVRKLEQEGLIEILPDGRLATRSGTDRLVEVLLPAPGEAVTCGLRLYLPKKQRRHIWRYMGVDWANKGTEGICQVLVWICLSCGKDKRE